MSIMKAVYVDVNVGPRHIATPFERRISKNWGKSPAAVSREDSPVSLWESNFHDATLRLDFNE